MTTPARQWDYLVQLSVERRYRGDEVATFFACVRAASEAEAWEKLRGFCRRNLTPAHGRQYLIGCRVYLRHGIRRVPGETVAGMLCKYGEGEDKDRHYFYTDQTPFPLPTGCLGLNPHWTNRMIYRVPGQRYWKRRAKLKLLDCEAANELRERYKDYLDLSPPAPKRPKLRLVH